VRALVIGFQIHGHAVWLQKSLDRIRDLLPNYLLPHEPRGQELHQSNNIIAPSSRFPSFVSECARVVLSSLQYFLHTFCTGSNRVRGDSSMKQTAHNFQVFKLEQSLE